MTCQQCKSEYDYDGWMVIIPNYLWLSIAKLEEYICDKCIEQRLGRSLSEDDFPAEPVLCYKNQLLHVREIRCNKRFFKERGMFQ